MNATTQRTRQIRRVEYHMGTAITLAASDLSLADADRFFAEIERLEGCLSRFQPDSDLSLLARGALSRDRVDWSVREVLSRCEVLREQTCGCFEHEPRAAFQDQALPAIDPNALAKGWIIDQAVGWLRLAGAREFFVNAGGDIVTSKRADNDLWKIGIQCPSDTKKVFATVEIGSGAVATSGSYLQGQHIRSVAQSPLASVTVVGPELATADALATAVHSSGTHAPDWWIDVDESYGLLTLDESDAVRWAPPASAGPAVELSVADGAGFTPMGVGERA